MQSFLPFFSLKSWWVWIFCLVKGIAIILLDWKRNYFLAVTAAIIYVCHWFNYFYSLKFPQVVFENFNLDLDFKLINLNCLDFKSIDFRDHFKFNNFNEFRQIKILNLLKLFKYLDFNHSNPNLYMHKFCYPSTPLVYLSERCLHVK